MNSLIQLDLILQDMHGKHTSHLLPAPIAEMEGFDDSYQQTVTAQPSCYQHEG